MKKAYLISLLMLVVHTLWSQKKTFADHWKFVGIAVNEPGYTVWGTSPFIIVVFFCASCENSYEKEIKPNIILILADDLGAWDVPFTSKGYERLAGQGTRQMLKNYINRNI